MMDNNLGKIGHFLVDDFLFHHQGHRRNEVVVGPKFGVDVSIVELPGGMAMAMTSDPLSLIPSLGLQESAWLSVHLMANDMATTGLPPMYGQFVLNLPSSFSKSDYRIYWEYIDRFCSEINLAITGGHTGFIEGQNSTIAGGGTFVTVGPKDQFLTSASAESGNTILVTKTCALSSSAILAMSFPETVKNSAGAEIYQLACESFYQTSSLNDALCAVDRDAKLSGVTAMHDVTEGGVLGAIYEMAVASNTGVQVDLEKMPLGTVQEKVCEIFSLDPAHCIGAGSMIIACKKESSEGIINRLSQKNIACTEVGILCDKEDGMTVIEKGEKKLLPYTETDPYWAAFFKALKEGRR